jgi:cytochrome c peroxidase
MNKVFVILLFIVIICWGGKFKTTPYVFPSLLYFPTMPENKSNPITNQAVLLGRYLFYDKILSVDSTMSCGSCHKQQYAFSDSPNDFSVGRNGVRMPRNTMALFNLAWYPAMFWDGKAASIEEQVFHPVRNTMEMNLNWVDASKRVSKNKFYKGLFSEAFNTKHIDSVLISKAIGQFLRSIISHQSKYDRVLNGEDLFTEGERQGFVLMNDQSKGDCLHCHTTDADVLGTTLTFSNNGLDDVTNSSDFKDKGYGAITGKATDNGKFIIPSLRNILLTAPYMHDGRFKTLEQVLDFYSDGVKQCANIDSKMGFSHQGGAHLSQEEKQKIISFLKTLTDSVFISNPEYADPFTMTKVY